MSLNKEAKDMQSGNKSALVSSLFTTLTSDCATQAIPGLYCSKMQPSGSNVSVGKLTERGSDQKKTWLTLSGTELVTPVSLLLRHLRVLIACSSVEVNFFHLL